MFRRGQPTTTSSLDARRELLDQLATAGTGRVVVGRHPSRAPLYVYGLLAPAWAARNQFAPVTWALAAKIAALMFERIQDRHFGDLANRVIAAPDRERRLKKYVADAINGYPDEEQQSVNAAAPSLVDAEASALYGRELSLRPTRQLIDAIYALGFGWGPLEPYLKEKLISEIMVNRHDVISVEREVQTTNAQGQIIRTAVKSLEPARFETPALLEGFVSKMAQEAGVELSYHAPTADLSLPNGERVNITVSPVSREPTITIRRAREVGFTLDRLVEYHSLSQQMRDFIAECSAAGANMMTYGPTSSGKTTFLSAVLATKDPDARLVIIEDTREIYVDETRHRNVVRMLTSAKRDMRALVKNALRQAPEHLIVGETRDHTALDLVNAMLTGQRGSLTTIHADSPKNALRRLVMLLRTAEGAPTQEPATMMVADSVHVVVHAARLVDKSRRIMSVDEVVGVEGGEFRVSNIFRTHITPNADGSITVEFRHNPDYVMSPRLAEMFMQARLDPDAWTGAAARLAGRRPQLYGTAVADGAPPVRPAAPVVYDGPAEFDEATELAPATDVYLGVLASDSEREMTPATAPAPDGGEAEPAVEADAEPAWQSIIAPAIEAVTEPEPNAEPESTAVEPEPDPAPEPNPEAEFAAVEPEQDPAPESYASHEVEVATVLADDAQPSPELGAGSAETAARWQLELERESDDEDVAEAVPPAPDFEAESAPEQASEGELVLAEPSPEAGVDIDAIWQPALDPDQRFEPGPGSWPEEEAAIAPDGEQRLNADIEDTSPAAPEPATGPADGAADTEPSTHAALGVEPADGASDPASDGGPAREAARGRWRSWFGRPAASDAVASEPEGERAPDGDAAAAAEAEAEIELEALPATDHDGQADIGRAALADDPAEPVADAATDTALATAPPFASPHIEPIAGVVPAEPAAEQGNADADDDDDQLAQLLAEVSVGEPSIGGVQDTGVEGPTQPFDPVQAAGVYEQAEAAVAQPATGPLVEPVEVDATGAVDEAQPAPPAARRRRSWLGRLEDLLIGDDEEDESER